MSGKEPVDGKNLCRRKRVEKIGLNLFREVSCLVISVSCLKPLSFVTRLQNAPLKLSCLWQLSINGIIYSDSFTLHDFYIVTIESHNSTNRKSHISRFYAFCIYVNGIIYTSFLLCKTLQELYENRERNITFSSLKFLSIIKIC